jgi:hypothetical protein
MPGFYGEVLGLRMQRIAGEGSLASAGGACGNL